MNGLLRILVLGLFLTFGMAFADKHADDDGQSGETATQEQPASPAEPDAEEAAEPEGTEAEDDAESADPEAADAAADETEGTEEAEGAADAEDGEDAGAADTTEADTGEGSVLDALRSNPEFSTFAEAVERAGLAGMLDQEGPFTILAPTNDAFEAAGIDIETMDEDELASLVQRHVVRGALTAEGLTTTEEIETLLGERLAVAPAGEDTVAGAEDNGEVAGGAEPTDPEDVEEPVAGEEDPAQVEPIEPEDDEAEEAEEPAEIDGEEDPEVQPVEPDEGGPAVSIGDATITTAATQVSDSVIYGINVVFSARDDEPDTGEGDGAAEEPADPAADDATEEGDAGEPGDADGADTDGADTDEFEPEDPEDTDEDAVDMTTPDDADTDDEEGEGQQ